MLQNFGKSAPGIRVFEDRAHDRLEKGHRLGPKIVERARGFEKEGRWRGHTSFDDLLADNFKQFTVSFVWIELRFFFDGEGVAQAAH
jgi:hypothetical protein